MFKKTNMRRIISYLLNFIIMIYQRMISPLFPPTCRYTPTCSEYAKEAINKYGAYKGLYLATKRLLTCHPWGGQGEDTLK